MMRSFREVRLGTVALCVLLLAGVPALAASSVALTAEVGGDNHAAQWKANTKQAFSGGSSTAGQVFPQGGFITWDVRVTASGTQAAGAGAGSPIYGAANVVFNIELRDASNNLVTVNPFKSTINDGTGSDVLAAAAFAVGFNVGGPGRCVDPTTAGGPLMGGVDASQWKVRSATYPKALNGQLLGMGAGYSPPSGATKSWVAAQMKAGVGMVTLPNSQPGLGTGPICEGQIDTTMLPQGSYTLTVVPRPGINVLRGDVSLTADQNAFATAAEQTSGSSVQFVIGPPLPPEQASNPTPADNATNITVDQVLSWTPAATATSRDVYFGITNPPPLIGNQTDTSYAPVLLEMDKTYFWRVDERNAGGPTTGPVWRFTVVPTLKVVSWQSVRTHGSAGELAIPLDPAKQIGGVNAQGPTSDPRRGGVRKILITFSKPIADPMAPIVTERDGTGVWPTYSRLEDGKTLEIDFPAGMLLDQHCYTIELAGVIYDYDWIEELSGDTNCSFRNLQGDTNSDGQVNLVDASFTKSKSGQSVLTNAKFDLTVDGAVNLIDASYCKSLNGHAGCQR
jgi:hypothetical protein